MHSVHERRQTDKLLDDGQAETGCGFWFKVLFPSKRKSVPGFSPLQSGGPEGGVAVGNPVGECGARKVAQSSTDVIPQQRRCKCSTNRHCLGKKEASWAPTQDPVTDWWAGRNERGA